jgi:hypothetical protein
MSGNRLSKPSVLTYPTTPGWCRAPAVLDLHQWATLQDLFVSRFT